MGTAEGMLAEARKSLGLGEPNHIQNWYADRNGSAFRYNFAWCDAAVTYWAHQSGNHAAVCPNGDRAYTVWHAQDFQKAGRWYAGTVENLKRAKPGDIVFFDWDGSNSIGAIDHVGVIEKVLEDGRVQTIEGNTGNRCLRRIRSAGSIAGYGRPDYDQAAPSKPADKPAQAAPRWPGRYLTQPPMMRGDDVRRWQARMRERGWRITVDGVYGPRSEEVCRAFQREKGLEVDGVVGPVTWRESWAAPIT
ncbi:peptidoglycan-binding protein [Thermomonospora amylolytica]|uniref:peptidoglycan-binding protein n=1 Tax=Thermomonospora amylolytica TaxID=1411117 RepID=UPI001F28FCD7|nr:peptidoglycan-binding protein [Thermomonospora amylolytica]